jgi:hypothetical protein
MYTVQERGLVMDLTHSFRTVMWREDSVAEAAANGCQGLLFSSLVAATTSSSDGRDRPAVRLVISMQRWQGTLQKIV